MSLPSVAWPAVWESMLSVRQARERLLTRYGDQGGLRHHEGEGCELLYHRCRPERRGEGVKMFYAENRTDIYPIEPIGITRCRRTFLV